MDPCPNYFSNYPNHLKFFEFDHLIPFTNPLIILPVIMKFSNIIT